MHTLNINEIFYSIQGEGSRAGLPCVFVRLQGCGLRCSWCDTPYALDMKTTGRMMRPENILAEAGKYACNFIEITGGEPLEQDGCVPFLTRLCDEGYNVAIETGGHLDISHVDPRVTIIMDLKCPGSGMEKKNRWENVAYLKPSDEIKFVIAQREDYEWTRGTIQAKALGSVCKEMLLSPVFGSCDARALAEWILADALPVRMQLQMHKYIWDPTLRGV